MREGYNFFYNSEQFPILCILLYSVLYSAVFWKISEIHVFLRCETGDWTLHGADMHMSCMLHCKLLRGMWGCGDGSLVVVIDVPAGRCAVCPRVARPE